MRKEIFRGMIALTDHRDVSRVLRMEILFSKVSNVDC